MATEKLYTKSQVVEALRMAMVGKSPVTASAEFGVSPEILRDVLKGKCQVPELVLEFLGLERVKNLYRRKVKSS